MRKLNVQEFVASVRSAPPALPSARSLRLAAQARSTGVVAECSPGGAALLLAIARMDAAMDGFPDRIPLTSPSGRNFGLEAVRTGGGWKFGGTVDALLGLKHDMPPNRLTNARAFALGALGLPVNPDSEAALARVSGWEGDLGALLDASFARLHDHSVRTVAAHAGHVLLALGLPPDRRAEVVAAAWRRCELFPEGAPEALDGVRDPLARAATAHQHELVAALLDPAMAPPGARMPEPGMEVTAALRLAVGQGMPDGLRTIRLLAAAGADLGPDSEGRTPLHLLADAAFTLGPLPAFIPMAELLVELGADPALADESGRTAAEYVADNGDRYNKDAHDTLVAALSPRRRAPGVA